ncbi:unnamed protein product [Schistocephalus solidus]|uniref:BZIP domain-containing protein n=1 Tax=Schistocephalus solidus TaxID=70667 RepID=A0A183T2E7_SCHSO|nr:unnamed protein product [Schistocephalus solidus]
MTVLWCVNCLTVGMRVVIHGNLITRVGVLRDDGSTHMQHAPRIDRSPSVCLVLPNWYDAPSRAIGESGKSTKELEKIIAKMKKVLDRALAENEQLRCTPAVVSQEQISRLQSEKVALQVELKKAQEAAGATLTEQGRQSEARIARLSREYEKLRKELEKERKAHEEANNRLVRSEYQLDALERENTQLQERLQTMAHDKSTVQSRRPTPRRPNQG